MNVAERQVESIFFAALERESAMERAAWLDEACADNEDLRRRVEQLLAVHPRLGDFLQPRLPALESTAAMPSLVEAPGTQIGPYKLLEQIGEGGFGVVFMAEQERPVRRRVALKVIKPGMDMRQVIARFEAERQALALMDHPNIAKVLDAGATETGRPYFVMELVRGVPITEYCDRHQLTPSERLDLFVTVCNAVQHAHQKGIIHRDIKPTNVLVTLHDDKPVVKVIDFGVAKAISVQLTDKTLFTGFAQMVGTPLYMSPEQAQMNGLDVDTRSDIYSLGVLLYELLTGTTPFDRKRMKEAGHDEIRRIIREEEPARPSARVSTLGPAGITVSANRKSDPQRLSQLFRGELDWLAMKALEKDRNHRYETANAFAADVQRYLGNEPVQACPPSNWYRFRKFARRNTAALVTSSALAAGVLVAIGSLIATVKLLAAGNAEIKAEQKQTQAALDREKDTNDELLRVLQREQRALYFQRIALAAREVEARNVGRAEELLEECPAPLRGWEWHYLKRRCRQEPLTFREHPGMVPAVAVSPDGRTVASTSLVIDGGEVRLREIRVWERATGKQIHRLLGHRGPAHLGFHPDGKLLFSAGEDRSLRAWDVATGKEVRNLKMTAVAVCLAVSPDGRLLATGNADNTLRVFDAADSKNSAPCAGTPGWSTRSRSGRTGGW